ncbi:right-handed parallel beta-helix repeat-containing protein [Rhodobacterales bacterium HKCCE2091]|nr:right-handed parallel beta-helix repeat-containing protein [Rhodobacterales bacterium HKCCE2091]
MNQVITDGLMLMPPSFADGLSVWSRSDGTPGSDTYATAGNAALVPADQDFGTCLEINKVDATTSIRYMGQTPVLPGLYLRVSARVKALAGNLPNVRIGAWAGDAGQAHVAGVTETGPETTLTDYGEVVAVSAIIGTGNRVGVDMPWGGTATYGHVGLDLTGPNGGTIRIESITVEDVTAVFIRKMMDWVDVRDYGATGDGVTDDSAAFVAADAAAQGRMLLVPQGDYFIGQNLTLTSPARFEGRLVMDDATRLALTENFELDSYADALGDEVLGLKKAIQALFNQSEHEAFDMRGRRILLDEPLDVQAAVGNKTTYANRRVLKNGQLAANAGPGWTDGVTVSTATWSSDTPTTLSGITNVASIEVGALVSGATGVGREVYVAAKNEASGTVTLTEALWGAPTSQTYTFRRFRYLLDFGGWQNLQRFRLEAIEFLAAGISSCVMLPADGLIFQVKDCFFTGPKDRGLTSAGQGCQGLEIDRCQFLSNEQALRVQDRTSIGFNINAGDAKIRNNRAVRFLHFGVIAGTGNIISGNHVFQGDSETDGLRSAGIIFTSTNGKSTISGNYIDNCSVEWGNEHDPAPEMSGEYSFHGMTITGNIFFSSGSAPWFRFIVLKPYGPGHYINGLSISDNLFKQTAGQQLDRVEMVDETLFPLDMGRTSGLLMVGNTFHGITETAGDPVSMKLTSASVELVWEADLSDRLPFGGQANSVLAALPEGAITNGAGDPVYTVPYATTAHGPTGAAFRLNWSEPVKGSAMVTASSNAP